MSRIKQVFQDLKAANRTALIPYVTAGDPHPDLTLKLLHEMVKAGADIIELGVPFSDPMADGPVIQRACERALAHNVTLNDVLNIVAEFRQSNSHTPIVLMGYTNPIEVMGYSHFAEAANKAGVDGVLTVDLPPEEAMDVNQLFKDQDLDSIFLLSPTSTNDRIERICQLASGFVYYVSLKGVTGAANLNVEEVASKLATIRSFSDLPIGVGFGIKDAATAEQISKIADAVVVGSALINKIVDHLDDDDKIQSEIYNLLSSMRTAIDASNP